MVFYVRADTENNEIVQFETINLVRNGLKTIKIP